MDELLATIADPESGRETLIQTIQELGPVNEPAHFWSDIANDGERYSQDHRRRAVFQLFQRHAAPGMTLSELAQLLNNPSWLADEDVAVVTALAGEMPVEWTIEDTVFVLSVFPELPDGRYDHWAIYLRVSGKISREHLIEVLQGGTVSADVRNAEVLEFALSPDDPTRVDW